jgi:class 3 adenylate cyclase
VRAARKYGIVPVGFLDGEIRTQRRLADAGRLARALENVTDPDELERRLRSRLGDPSLTVLRWSDPMDAYLDVTGRIVDLPTDGADPVATRLERSGRPFAAVLHAPTVLTDREVAATVTAAVRLAVDNALLRQEVAARVADIRTLPTGTVTFLMTDIEGSTALLHRLGDRYPQVLEDVRSIAREAVSAAGGREVDARADELFAAFTSVDAGLSAALAIVRRLAARAWPDDERVRVRAGLHVGRPTLTDSGYVGAAVNTVARVAGAGHGGQILVSEPVQEALRSLPDGVAVRRLGTYRLHGIPGGQVLHQVVIPDLPARFPPLRVPRLKDRLGVETGR